VGPRHFSTKNVPDRHERKRLLAGERKNVTAYTVTENPKIISAFLPQQQTHRRERRNPAT
jgi:hypothetical protein